MFGMLNFCRLCAEEKPPQELTSSILKLRDKLIMCCQWKPSQVEHNMPQSICDFCNQELYICSSFIEKVEAAREKLEKMVVKVEQDCDEVSPALDFVNVIVKEQESEVSDNNETSPCDDDCDNRQSEDENPPPIETESRVVDKREERTQIKKLKAVHPALVTAIRFKHDSIDFFKVLAKDDSNADGSLKEGSLEKLEQHFPYIRTHFWDEYDYKCSGCEKCFRNAAEFRSHCHLMHENESLRYNCVYCNKQYGQFSFLSRHITDRHMTHLKYCCQACRKFFITLKKLKLHSKQHTDFRFQCHKCEKSFTAKNNLLRHIRESHLDEEFDKKYFPCKVCKEKFESQASLDKHSPIHLETNRHMCEKCGADYKRPSNLRIHMKLSHSEMRPYKCDQCNKSFKLKTKLTYHKELHKETKEIVCDICEKRFSLKQALVSHMKIHTGQKPFPCRYCDKIFRASSTRKGHERIHTGVKPYVCVQCEYASVSYANLSKHMRRMHGLNLRDFDILNRCLRDKKGAVLDQDKQKLEQHRND